MKYNIQTDSSGTKRYYVNDKLHREDGPAIEYANGTKYWFKNGKLHRVDGPAIEWYNGCKAWMLNDKHYGLDNNFTIQSWKTFVNTLIFA